MLIAASFVIDKRYKQPKCPTADEWINKMWCIHTREYFSAIKKSEALIHAITCMNLVSVMPSEVSWSQQTTYCMISFI